MQQFETPSSDLFSVTDDNNNSSIGSYLSSNNSAITSSCSPGRISNCSESDAPDIYTFPAAKAAAAAMPKILENGRKVFGPPPKWNGSRPTVLCELYLTKIPANLEEVWFLVWLHRFGTVYEFRLMMDSGSLNRGYAFVRYSKLSEALTAFEVLSYHFEGGVRMGVFRSQGKNRLYVSKIPKVLSVETVKEGFKKIFPKLQDVTSYETKNGNGEENRGFAFIQFYNHEEALEAKKRTTPGRVRMWDTDLKVQWAKPKNESFSLAKTSANKRQVNDNPRTTYDYNAKLRLYCLANDWCVPIVIYGEYFRSSRIQYGGILLKCDITGESCFMLMEILIGGVFDVHLLMSEVAVLLIEREAGFPQTNFLLRLQQEHAQIVATFSSFDDMNSFCKTDYYFYDTASLTQLAQTIEMLAKLTSLEVLRRYKQSFLTTTKMPYLKLEGQPFNSICGILPKFRNNAPLKYNLNDTEINLMLINENSYIGCRDYNKNTLNNRFIRPLRHISGKNIMRLKSQRPYLNTDGYNLQCVDAKEGVSFYHPIQQMNTPPIWISGRPYQEALFN